MVVASDFETDRIQATAFVTSQELSPAKVLRRALGAWGDIYDADPVSLPLPQNIPSEVPGVILQNADGTRRIEVARSRVNISVARRIDQEDLSISEIYPELAKQLSEIFAVDQTPIGRLAAVVQRGAEVEDPASALAQQYFRSEWLAAPINGLQTLELHGHKVYELPMGLQVNSWMRIRTGERIPNNIPVLAVEQDINTLSEQQQTSNFDSESVAEFYGDTAEELSAILRHYFPETANGQNPRD